MARLKAPWPQETVDKLNQYQNAGQFHPFTCPGNKPDCEKHRNLIATTDGWVCQCGEYKQDWTH